MLTPRLFLSVLVISELWTYILARETILAFYGEDPIGAIQRKVYSLGAASFNNISVDIFSYLNYSQNINKLQSNIENNKRRNIITYTPSNYYTIHFIHLVQ